MKRTAMRTPSVMRRQRGVTLIIVMLILVVVTVLGIGGAQIALLGERSTRYDRDYLLASQSAEAALMDAEFDIRGPNTSTSKRVTTFAPENGGYFVVGCGSDTATRGLCAPVAEGQKPVWTTVDFTDTSGSAHTAGFGDYTGRVFDNGNVGIKPVQAPRYIIEMVEDRCIGCNAAGPSAPKLYRVTAIGFGPRTDIQVVMQIAFRKEKG